MSHALEDDEEDAPPELGSMASQIAAVQSGPVHIRAAITDDQHLQDAEVNFTTTGIPAVRQQPHASSSTPQVVSKEQIIHKAAAQPLKKGFFDSKPTKAKAGKAGIVSLSGKKVNGTSRIPEAFIIPPDEQQRKYQAARSELMSALQPDKSTIDSVLANPQLLSGFDDPEVMKAVSEIGADPKKIDKYKSNPKVLKFYELMGSLMAEKCEAIAQTSTM